ncbi:hypothetical protein ACB376_21640 [Klebsiella electrica]
MQKKRSPRLISLPDSMHVLILNVPTSSRQSKFMPFRPRVGATAVNMDVIRLAKPGLAPPLTECHGRQYSLSPPQAGGNATACCHRRCICSSPPAQIKT